MRGSRCTWQLARLPAAAAATWSGCCSTSTAVSAATARRPRRPLHPRLGLVWVPRALMPPRPSSQGTWPLSMPGRCRRSLETCCPAGGSSCRVGGSLRRACPSPMVTTCSGGCSSGSAAASCSCSRCSCVLLLRRPSSINTARAGRQVGCCGQQHLRLYVSRPRCSQLQAAAAAAVQPSQLCSQGLQGQRHPAAMQQHWQGPRGLQQLGRVQPLLPLAAVQPANTHSSSRCRTAALEALPTGQERPQQRQAQEAARVLALPCAGAAA